MRAALSCLGLLLVATTASAQMRKPPAIEATGVPAISSDIADRLAQYQEFRTASFLGWAPDGKGILISTRFGNVAQLHRVYEPGGRREQVTWFAEPATGRFLGRPGEGPSGDLVVTLSAGGSENNQVYFVDAATGKSVRITDGKSRHGLGPVKDDGGLMVLTGNQRNGKDADIYVANPRVPGSLTMILEGAADSWQPQDISPDGYRVALVKYISINESYPAILDIVSRKLTYLKLPTDKPAAYTDLHFSPDGKSIYLATDARAEYRELAKYDIATGGYSWPLEGNTQT
ncbi:MAG TPA: hypothetical protein VNC50_22350, partial [Planctomycetia bacterium]|nr:hypothetical protein [Planctomycetia bacterium]